MILPEERNKYLSRLDGFMNAAYIVGPALGGILANVNNRFPMLKFFHSMTHRYVAGIGSGIALVVAVFYLEESNPMVNHIDSLLGEENGYFD